MPLRGTPGFVSVGDYLSANKGTLADNAAAVRGDVSGAISDARAGAEGLTAGGGSDPTSLTGYLDALTKGRGATQQATALGQQGGIANALQGHYGKGPGASPDPVTRFAQPDGTYTQDKAMFDAGLLGGRFNEVQSRGRGLSAYLDKTTAPTSPTSVPGGEPDVAGPNNRDVADPLGLAEGDRKVRQHEYDPTDAYYAPLRSH